MVVIDAVDELTAALPALDAMFSGPVGVAIYLGGPCQDVAHSPAYVGGLRQLGRAILPVFPGRQDGANCAATPSGAAGGPDGAQAVRELIQLGFPAGSPVALDVEAVTTAHPQLPAYYASWAATVSGGGFVPGVYGLGSLRGHIPAGFFWIASWRSGNQPVPVPALPQLGQDALTVGWQFAHDLRVAGCSVDVSVFTDGFLGGLVPAQPEAPRGLVSMVVVTATPVGSGPVFVISNAGKYELANDEERDEWLAVCGQPPGVPGVKVVGQYMLDRLPLLPRVPG